MQGRRGQLGRGLVCLLAANGLFWGKSPKNGPLICRIRDDLNPTKGKGRGESGVLRVLPAPEGRRVQEHGGCHLLSVFFSLSDDVCKCVTVDNNLHIMSFGSF